MHTLLRPLLLLPLAFSLAACDSNDDPDGPGPANTRVGTVTASVTGDVSATFDGSAYAINEFNTIDYTIDVTLFADPISVLEGLGYTGATAFLAVTDEAAVRPGTYTIDLDSFTYPRAELSFFPSLGSFTNAFEAVGGTMTLLSVSDEEIRGSFNVQLEDPNQGRTATLSGSFVAPVLEDPEQ